MKIVTFLDNVAYCCITKISKHEIHYMYSAGTALGVKLVACHCFNDLYSGKLLRKESDEMFICIAKGDYYDAAPALAKVTDLFRAERTYWKIKGLKGTPQHAWTYQFGLSQPPNVMFDACE